MPRLTCHYPGGYSGVREPGGNPRLRLDLAEGSSAEVSEAKAAQLLRDFPGYFTTDHAPAARAAAVETVPATGDDQAQEAATEPAAPADESTPAPAGRRGTRRKS